MPFPHTTQPNEDLPAIAALYGFSSWEKVWNIDENKDLRDLRSNPFALRSGDIVYVPEPTSKPKDFSTESTHDVTVKRMWFELKVAFFDGLHKPLKDASYDYTRDDLPPEAGTTDGEGFATLKVGGHSKIGLVEFKGEGGEVEHIVELKFGEMEPLGTTGATEKMLQNIGYMAGGDKASLSAALRRFQTSMGVSPTGEVDAQTLTWLEIAASEGIPKAIETAKKAHESAANSEG